MLSKFEYAVQLKLFSCFVRKQNLYLFARNSAVAVDDINVTRNLINTQQTLKEL